MQIIDSHDFGRIIKENRVAQNLTQADLAFASGCGPRFIVDLEKGKPTCELGKALYVARMLGLKLEANLPHSDVEP